MLFLLLLLNHIANLLSLMFVCCFQDVYTPVNVNTRSVNGLLRRLEAKFPQLVKAHSIENVFQKSTKNLVKYYSDILSKI